MILQRALLRESIEQEFAACHKTASDTKLTMTIGPVLVAPGGLSKIACRGQSRRQRISSGSLGYAKKSGFTGEFRRNSHDPLSRMRWAGLRPGSWALH